MKQLLFILSGAALLLSAASCKHESLDDRCAREAREYTQKQCPQESVKGITLDSMAFHLTGTGDKGSDRTFAYYYTFSDPQDSLLRKMMAEYPDTARQRMDQFRGELLNALSTNVSMKMYKDKGFNFEYTYFSKRTKGILLHFKFTRADYKH